jgi:hypothetical protein
MNQALNVLFLLYEFRLKLSLKKINFLNLIEILLKNGRNLIIFI